MIDIYDIHVKAGDKMLSIAVCEKTRKIAEEQRDEAIQKRREEREKSEERTTVNRNADADTVEISEEGKVLLEENIDLNLVDLDITAFTETKH